MLIPEQLDDAKSLKDTACIESLFAELPGQTATLTDLRLWFEAHPHVVAGSAADIPGSIMTVGLAFNSSKIIHTALKYEAFEVTLRVSITSESVDNVVIRSLCPDYVPGVVTHFDQAFELELPLTTWPLATAMVAANYLERKHEYANDLRIGSLALLLDKYLSQHFVGITLDQLSTLHGAGLLPLHDEGRIDKPSFCTLLFRSRAPSSPTVVPTDLMFL